MSTNSPSTSSESKTSDTSIGGEKTKQLFTSQSITSNYALYRPTYPKGMYEVIADELKKRSISVTQPGELVVDMACGSGQATFGLAELPLEAKLILGTDISAAQIEHARSKIGEKTREYTAAETTPKFFFEVGSVEHLQGQIASLQTSLGMPVRPSLVMVAQAFHWFNVHESMKHLHPLLSPIPSSPKGGAFIVIFYGQPVLPTPRSNKTVSEDLYLTRLGKYWAGGGRQHVDNCYSEMCKLMATAQEPGPWEVTRFDPPEMAAVGEASGIPHYVDEKLRIVKHWPISSVKGYLSSWSAYGTWLKVKAEGTLPESELVDPIEECTEKLVDEFGSLDAVIQVTYPIGLFVCTPKAE